MEYLNKFENEMNLTGKNAYIGQRYVPKIFGEWDINNIYEPLSIVTYNGNSFTSRKEVPNGTELTNKEYWAVTGNYDAQVDFYRQEVGEVSNKLEVNETNFNQALNNKSEKKFDMQSDFVSQIARLSGGYEKMYFKRENTPGWVTVMLVNKNEHLTWTFRNNTYDEYYTLGDCFTGNIENQLIIYDDKNYSGNTGTWVTSAPNTHYATSVGATMTAHIEGEKIEFHHYADNRGGIWEFILDDDETKKVTVSTWSENPVSTNNKTLFEGLEFGNHKVVGTFKGDDPNHAPSSGAGTSRGWVYVDGLNGYLTFRGFKKQLANIRTQDILMGFSNKEYAFQIRKANSNHSYQFIPMHNSIGTVFEKYPIQFVTDSSVLSKSDILNLKIGEFHECTKFSVIQSCYGRNPETTTENLVEVNTVVTVNKTGNVEIAGKIKPLVDIEIDNGYGIMFPLDKDVTTKCLTSIGNEYQTIKTDGSSTLLDDEEDKTTSFMFVSSENKDYVAAVNFNNPKDTLRTGIDKGGNPIWLEHRDNIMQKLYFRQYQNASLKTSEVFKFSATFNCGKIKDIYNIV